MKAHKTTFREEDSMLKIKGKSYERADQIIDKTNVKGNMKSNSNPKRQLVFQKIMSTTAYDLKPRYASYKQSSKIPVRKGISKSD